MAACEVRTAADAKPTCGPPIDGYELRMGSQQQLLVRGPGIADSAWQDGQEIHLCDQQGWLASGDAARIDATGTLHLLGRLDLAFTSGGETIFIEDIEAQLLQHPSVSACCVVAIEDSHWGHRAAAWVVGNHHNTELPALLEEWSRSHLSAAQRPRLWHAAQQLPLLTSGKIDRQAVYRFFTQGHPPLGDDPAIFT